MGPSTRRATGNKQAASTLTAPPAPVPPPSPIPRRCAGRDGVDGRRAASNSSADSGTGGSDGRVRDLSHSVRRVSAKDLEPRAGSGLRAGVRFAARLLMRPREITASSIASIPTMLTHGCWMSAPAQVTGFCSAPDGRIYAVTGNIGTIVSIGADLDASGTFESDVFDAGRVLLLGPLE